MSKKTVRISKEDYLEAILININRAGACRSTDVANQAGVSKASTSVALKKLEEEGCIIRDDWRILLSDKGREIAEQVYEKHLFFREWFTSLGVDESIAEAEACMIEHILSDETYRKIRDYVMERDCKELVWTNKN